jgi:probable addiction module antidote protein
MLPRASGTLEASSMPIETVPFDSAQYLKTEADIARYLQAVLEANDPAHYRHALTQVVRARAAMRQACKSAG